MIQKTKRKILILSTHAEVPLTQGKIALIDLDDVEKVKKYSWCIQQHKNNIVNTKIYAKTAMNHTQVTMHRFILNCTKNQMVDHINGNSLDNRRCNLRTTNKQGNAANRPKDRIVNATSKFKGVYKPKNYKKWIARIHVNGVGISLGSFISEIEAAIAYNKAAVVYFGEFACLNQV